MNNKSLSPNRAAGKFNYEQQVEHYKKNGMFIRYMAKHYVVMGNAYDYVRVTFPEKPLKNFLEFWEEAKKVNIDYIADSKLKLAERINIAKSLALEDFIKNSVKKEVLYAIK